MAHQGRAREMEHYLAAAEAAAPDDPDLRAGAWAIGRGIGALLAEDRSAARQAFARARAAAPDQHARILNPYEGPELLLRVLAAEAGHAEIADCIWLEWSKERAGLGYGSVPPGQ